MSDAYEVFISFKFSGKDGKPTRDAWLGEHLYQGLMKEGINTFYSPVTLREVGADDYQRHIDAALDQAVVMIVIGTEKDFMESEWVRAEWETFIGEVRGGRKSGRVFTYTEGMNVKELPLPLRKFQMIVHGLDSAKTLIEFIKSSANDDVIKQDQSLVPDKFFNDAGRGLIMASLTLLSFFLFISWHWKP